MHTYSSFEYVCIALLAIAPVINLLRGQMRTIRYNNNQ
jgi:hypothetical protein